jgi:NADH-quinone oxidoreductase subunit J
VIAAVLAEVQVAPNVFFGIIAAIAVFAALRVVTTSNVVHAALYLMVVLGSVAATFVVLAAEFIAAAQVLVYIGAIVVLLLFGVMLTRARIGGDVGLDYDQKWLGGLVAALMLAVMGYSLWDRYEDVLLPAEREVQRTTDVADSIFATYIVPFEAISVLLLAALIGAIVVARRD